MTERIELPPESDTDIREKLTGDAIPEGDLWRVEIESFRPFRFDGDEHATLFCQFANMPDFELQMKPGHTTAFRKAFGTTSPEGLIGKRVLLKRGPVPRRGKYHMVMITGDAPIDVARDFTAAETPVQPEATVDPADVF